MHSEEQKLTEFLETELIAGRIPGPTAINAHMGWNGGNNIQRSWATRLRIKLFRQFGLELDAATGRWVKPS